MKDVLKGLGLLIHRQARQVGINCSRLISKVKEALKIQIVDQKSSAAQNHVQHAEHHDLKTPNRLCKILYTPDAEKLPYADLVEYYGSLRTGGYDPEVALCKEALDLRRIITKEVLPNIGDITQKIAEACLKNLPAQLEINLGYIDPLIDLVKGRRQTFEVVNPMSVSFVYKDRNLEEASSLYLRVHYLLMEVSIALGAMRKFCGVCPRELENQQYRGRFQTRQISSIQKLLLDPASTACRALGDLVGSLERLDAALEEQGFGDWGFAEKFKTALSPIINDSRVTNPNDVR